ncbi:MAG: DUF4236 domain-containing protein [Clostridia bacterium]|nr:DUF4236 domain-containing protein [Clostridia bacterium]
MRFRKSLKIAKGVKLNLSKTGASFTLGTGKGISLNLGTKGAFLNWSIPGTGVYDRVRLDTFVKDKLGSMFGFGKASAEEAEEAGAAEKKPAAKGRKTAKASAAKSPARPSDEEMEAIAQEIALVNIHQMGADVQPAAEGALDEAEAERLIEAWMEGSEAPIAFEMQAQVLPDKGIVMIDLDLPEIEDMPQSKLAELADGTIKIKKKTKKEQYEDYKTCVFGLGEYVASHLMNVVDRAQKVVVSAYTQRRDEKTGDMLDVFIYSVAFDRAAFAAGYQEKDPYEFCGKLKSRFYVLASGVMKEIAPFEAEEL